MAHPLGIALVGSLFVLLVMTAMLLWHKPLTRDEDDHDDPI
jgi:hypothetical protein